MRNYFLASIALLLATTFSFSQNSRQRDIDAFISQTGAIATTDKATSSLNFLRFPIGQALSLEGSSPERKALFFLTKYPGLFERKAKDSYQVKESKRDNYGLDHVTMQQYYDRVPIYDGVLKFHFNKEGGLTSVNGNFIIAEKLNVTSSISSAEAGQQAIKLVTGQKLGKFSAPLKINKNTLLVFQKGLAQGYRGPLHLVYEVEVRNDADVREFLYIDAHTKELVEQFTGMHGIDRKLYETFISDQNLKWQESDGTSGPIFGALNQWKKSEIESSEHIYNLMKNAFGQNSYNNADATMMTVDNIPNGCPNANWNGISANFCSGGATDDIVAHEWAHAYTEHTSGLIYAWQAGALNESYSDIWGETVDQLNGYFDAGENNAQRNGCASSTKWQIGEQASNFGGAIRDMWDPTCKGSPGKVSDPQYSCSPADHGNVHSNSGIINHAFALLADGGNYNGQNITAIGLTKAAHIFWRAQSSHITSTTDFAAQADILEAVLTELIGIDLAKLSTSTMQAGLSGEKITASDLIQLKKVISAVEMRANGCLLNPNSQPLFETLTPLCKGALPGNAFFYEDFENGSGAWITSNNGVFPTWTTRNWVIDDTPPGGRNGKVLFADNFNGGDCVNNLQSGVMSVTSPLIIIPLDATGPFNLAFDHFVSLQNESDGGNLKYKIGNGSWTLIPKSAFIDNAYNAALLNCMNDCDNPLLSQDVFTGGNGGSLTSNWGQSRIDLSSLGLSAGQTIQFRWDLGSDGCGSWEGWYIDDIRVYSCSLPTVQFTTTTTSVNEGEANLPGEMPNQCLSYIEKKITIKINKAPSQPVLVTLNPPTGTAQPGNNADYTLIPNNFILQAGTLSKDILIRVYNDANFEGDETVLVSYSLSLPNGGNASTELFNQQHTVTLIDDELVPENTSLNLIDANFNDGLPIGWKTIGEGSFPENWDVVDYKGLQNLDPSGTPYLYTNSGWGFQAPGQLDRIIETIPFNSLDAKSLNVSFFEFFLPISGIKDFPEQGTVDVWDGSIWHNLLTQNKETGESGDWDSPANREIAIPLAFRNAAMKIRFRYIADWNGLWAIDNFKITATYNNNIQTTISQTPDSQYLGPNATVYFRDPTSGDLIAKIKNLTAHDYGCTSVQVDRAGIDETNWVGTKKITKKTFKVTPTNVSPNGNYEITLYYKASELANFNGADIKSMGKSDGGIQQATVANSQTAPVQMAMFNNDYAYTATFNSGFSGFGLSDAAAGSALPVTLVKFEGKNTSEGNVLDWETSTELNNDYFIVERSVDAEKFVEISRMEGVGNSAIRNTYSFTDNSFINYLNYYRLKQVDKDGTFAYSRMIAVESPGKDGLKYFPNPVQSLLNIKIPENGAKSGNVSVINAAGQVVLSKENVKIQKGELSIDLSKLVTGIYQIVVTTENGSYHSSVVKAP
ncbi:M4 family metallopeptidase [Dyadobacter sp. CY323]|uniref:M4 family metallopeptidase n=1 Tax=Dyadobacter sp. CY323 TaxID=2907302 RepID=UPI001F469B15|nr:M4 family metallopeptidase [Dyadobacter sp. CY323]MCE6988254.1 M4 family metallopeptidase [Dyadobacter sp. CY323]